MKRKNGVKRFSMSGGTLFKWHALAFTVFTVGLWMSVLSMFSYYGNAEVSFEVFRPFLTQRMTLNIVWGILLLVHFGGQQVWIVAQRRAVRGYEAALYAGGFTADRLALQVDETDDFMEDGEIKQKGRG